MKIIQYSLVIFYDLRGMILIQDRRNLGKDEVEWGWFGGRAERNELPLDTALREIQEELNIQLSQNNLTYIGKTIVENLFEEVTKEGSVFVSEWKEEYNKDFIVLEGAGFEWVSPDEMRSRKIYDEQRIHLSIFENYIQNFHA